MCMISTYSSTTYLGLFASYTDAPLVTCQHSEAHLGDVNVYVSCQVRAKPEVTSLFRSAERAPSCFYCDAIRFRHGSLGHRV